MCRDPIYGDIRLTQLEWEAVHTRELRRLRRIRQLGLTNYVYIGAEHSRLSHSIGCVHRVEQILSTIEAIEGVPVDLETRLVARMYALIHDVSHVAFGHTVEDELGIYRSHDHNGRRIDRLLLSTSSTLGALLRSSEIGRATLAHFDPEATVHRRTDIPDLVSGSTGADVLDYIDRDAIHCGLDHRVDSALFRQFRWHHGPSKPGLVSLLYGREGLRVDRQYAVESLLAERYALFLKVYTHKTKTAASALLGKAILAAIEPGTRGKADFSETEYEWFGDEELLQRLVNSRKTIPAKLARELFDGHLPRPVFRAPLLSDDDLLLADDPRRSAYGARIEWLSANGFTEPQQRQLIEQDLARSVGLDPTEVILYCPIKAPGLQRVNHTVSTNERTVKSIDAVSGPYRNIEMKHLGLWEFWAFSRATNRETDHALAAAIGERLGLSNLISQDRRADRLF